MKISYENLRDILTEVNERLKEEYREIVEINLNDGLIIGDLHGDYFSLLEALKYYKNGYLIFLGDYIDRGKYQIETLYKVLELKLKNWNNVILLKGNHEYLEEIQPSPHDFPEILIEYFGEKGYEIYNLFLEFTGYLPYVIYVRNFAIILHGGIPIDINFSERKLSREDKIQIVWNDISYEIEDYTYNIYRGVGYIIGRNIIERTLEKYNVKYIIRGHEYPCRFEENVITVFTSKEPYNLEKVCILSIKDRKINPIFF